MVSEENKFSAIRAIANNLAGSLAKLGERDGADAIAILIHVIAYRAADYDLSNNDRSADEYSENLTRLRNYLDGYEPTLSKDKTPSPTDSAESD